MAQPNIKMTRIDERLIHGQGQMWIKSLGVNFWQIMIRTAFDW